MEPLQLEVTASSEEVGSAGRRAVRAAGEIDMATSGELSRFFEDLLAGGAGDVVLDAQGVSFLDSTGLRVLVDIASRLDDVGGSLTIDPMSSSVRRVLEITGLLDRYTA